MLLVVSFIFILILRFDDGLKLITFSRSRETRHNSDGNAVRQTYGTYSRGHSTSKINAAKPSSPSESLSPPKTDDDNNADRTRGSLVRIIEDSWSRVSQLIPESTLILCEEVLLSIIEKLQISNTCIYKERCRDDYYKIVQETRIIR